MMDKKRAVLAALLVFCSYLVVAAAVAFAPSFGAFMTGFIGGIVSIRVYRNLRG